jgi:hypothetical protein
LWYFVGFLLNPKSNRKPAKYHNVWTILKSNRTPTKYNNVWAIPKLIENQQNTTMSEQFQNLIENLFY